ncbi:MAG: peptidylprolyl isomerase [Halobacteriales archaeon]
MIAAGDTVTLEYTGRLDDGTVFDTTHESVAAEAGMAEAQPDREYAPLTVEVGSGRIIDGLEEALLGMEEGATDTVMLPPEEAYGEWSEENVREYDAEAFAEMVGGRTPEAGDYIETEEGGVAEITHVDEATVRVDFNHELAGETLEFDLEVVDVS